MMVSGIKAKPKRGTGYYARASENGHKACATRYVHLVENGKPICGYKPHPTMQFMFCSVGFYMDYVDCPTCREKGRKADV